MKKEQLLNKVKSKVMAQKSTDSKTCKLYLHGDIGPGWFDAVNLETVKDQLRRVNDVDTIEVHINSYGGDVFESIAILNYLKYDRTEKIITYVDGIAASGGSIIFMAGEERIMPSNTQLMIHNPWTITYGNAKELRKTADDLEKIETSVEECYLSSFVGEQTELKNLLDREEFLTADESLTLGLSTKTVRETQDDPIDEDNLVMNLMKKYSNKVPKDEKTPEETKPNLITNFINIYKTEED